MKTIIKAIVPTITKTEMVSRQKVEIKSKFGKFSLRSRFYCLLHAMYYFLGFRLLYQKDDPPDQYHSRSGLVAFDN